MDAKGSMVGNGNVLVEVNAAVRELAELSSLLDLCSAKVQSASAIIVVVCLLNPRSMSFPANVYFFTIFIV
jgi:hypothetical protein